MLTFVAGTNTTLTTDNTGKLLQLIPESTQNLFPTNDAETGSAQQEVPIDTFTINGDPYPEYKLQ